MTYTAPRTWIIGEPVDAALLNVHLKDNLLSLRGLNDAAIRLHRTAVFSVPNNTRSTHIPWQASAYSTGMTWSSGTNPSRITVPTTGTYLLAANVKFANTAGGRRGVGWRLNGGTAFDMDVHPGNGVDTCNSIELIDLTANDYIEIYPFQNSGGAINTAGTTEGDCWVALSLFGSPGAADPLWFPPRTWASGEILSPALLNTHLRDEVMNLRNLKGCSAKVWMSEDQSISNAVRGKITWDSFTRNNGGLWIGGSQLQAPVAGIYLLDLNVEWNNDGTQGVAGIGYRINDSSTSNDLAFQEGGSAGQNLSGGDLIQLAAGDILEAYAFQDSVESLSLHGGTTDRTRLSLTLWAAAA